MTWLDWVGFLVMGAVVFWGFHRWNRGNELKEAQGVRRKCFHCSMAIPPTATTCPHCQENPLLGGFIEAPVAASMKRCPDCAEEVRGEAKKCRFCQHSFQ